MEPTIGSALANFLLLVVPAIIWSVVVRFKTGLSLLEIAGRLGLRAPQPPFLMVGLALALVTMGITVAMTRFGIGFNGEGSPIHFLVGFAQRASYRAGSFTPSATSPPRSQ